MKRYKVLPAVLFGIVVSFVPGCDNRDEALVTIQGIVDDGTVTPE